MARTLSIGMVGQDVADMQAALNYHLPPPNPPHTPPGPPRPPLVTDGRFGLQTDARLREFQRLNGLVVDGKAGPITDRLFTITKEVTVKIRIVPEDEVPVVQSAAGFRGGATPFSSIPGLFAQVAPGTPPSQPAPLIAPVQLQNVQVQAGGNLTLAPILGPGGQAKAIFLSVQFSWVERRDGRHLELALGSQFATALTNETFGLSTSSAQVFAGVTVADVLAIDKANFHLFSPSAQVSFQRNVESSVFKSVSVGVSVQNQIAWDFVKDGNNPLFTLFCQQQLGWSYDFTDRKGTIAPSFLVGATWQTSFF